MSQYAHSIDINYLNTVQIFLNPHDDVSISLNQANKGLGNWALVEIASLDAAEKMAQDMLAAIKRRREMTEAQLDTEFRRNEDAYAIDHDYEQALADLTPPNPNPGPAWEAKELCPADVNDSDDSPF